MIVVDTNILASLHLETERTADAERLLRKDPEWAAPYLWRSELRNVLATHVRLGRFDLSLAAQVMDAAERLMAGGEFEVASLDVLPLAQQSGCSAYDCEFVALAQALHVPLVTSDRKILGAFDAVAVSLETFIGQG